MAPLWRAGGGGARLGGMVFALFPGGRAEPLIQARRLFLRPPLREDWRDWAELRAASRDHLAPYEPVWAPDALTRAAYRRRLQRYAEDRARDLGHAFHIFLREGEVLVGGVTMSNLRRGVSQSASVGYWIGLAHAGRGYMSEALAALCTHAFDTLALHRLEAACLPGNIASRKVLERCGFVREGLARRYLRINGAWQDHLLYALLRDDLPH